VTDREIDLLVILLLSQKKIFFGPDEFVVWATFCAGLL